MTYKTLSHTLLFMVLGAMSMSCSENISDCPTRMCIVAGGWKLTDIIADDTPYDGDISNYKLILTMPDPATATSSFFSRTQFSGSSDDGSWSLENNETMLRLIPNNDQTLIEDWIIESMTPRRMVLLMIRDVDIKQGPAKIELILEPV
jgi:hypothetical protein